MIIIGNIPEILVQERKMRQNFGNNLRWSIFDRKTNPENLPEMQKNVSRFAENRKIRVRTAQKSMKNWFSPFTSGKICAIIPNVRCGNALRGISAVGSAFEWHSKGQGFDSPMLHHKRTPILIQRLAFSFCPESLASQGFFQFVGRM